MLEFTIEAKELKEMIDKVSTVINKKASVKSLRTIYFQVTENGTLKAFGTDMDHWLEVESENAYNTSIGVCGINIDDIKVLTKMTGDVTMIDNGNEINVINGRKKVTMIRHEDEDIFVPSTQEDEVGVLKLKEDWLLDTLMNLKYWLGEKEVNKLFNVFHFSTKYKRVEALEGHKLAIKKLPEGSILENKNVMLNGICVPVFKKTMNKKSKKDVVISEGKKYVKVKGNNFTYLCRVIDAGTYYDTEKLFEISSEACKFTVNKADMLQVIEYNNDMGKGELKPNTFYFKDNMMYSYMKTKRYELFDFLPINAEKITDETMFSFNPQFVLEAFKVVDSENPLCICTSNKGPAFIRGNEYEFLILPVYNPDTIANAMNRIPKLLNASCCFC